MFDWRRRNELDLTRRCSWLMMMDRFMSARTTATEKARRRSATSKLGTKALLLPTVSHTKPVWSTTSWIFDGRTASDFIYDVFSPEQSKLAVLPRAQPDTALILSLTWRKAKDQSYQSVHQGFKYCCMVLRVANARALIIDLRRLCYQPSGLLVQY